MSELKEQDKMDEQDKRIETILGNSDGIGFDKAVGIFYEYLKPHLQLLVEVTGIEDFRWEEPYILGGWSKRQYEQLKKTQPSYRDRYQLLGIERGTASEWMLFAGKDIAAHVRRVSDSKEFYLGLAELKVADKKSPNYQIIDDYAL